MMIQKSAVCSGVAASSERLSQAQRMTSSTPLCGSTSEYKGRRSIDRSHSNPAPNMCDILDSGIRSVQESPGTAGNAPTRSIRPCLANAAGH